MGALRTAPYDLLAYVDSKPTLTITILCMLGRLWTFSED